MWAALAGICGRGLTVLGAMMTMIGFLVPVLGFQVPKDTLIALGNIAFFVGALWMIVMERKEREKLQAQLQPKLAILYEAGEPYEQLRGSYRIFLIMVQNVGTSAIEDVRVYISTITSQAALPIGCLPQWPVELGLVSEDPQKRELSPKKSSLNHGESDYFDIVSKWEGEGQTADYITMWYGIRNMPTRLPCRRYQLTITAMGRNVASRPWNCVIDIDDQGRLRFGPA